MIGAGIQLDGASDHGVSEALYLRDPDENGVELYWDRPKEQWPRKPDGSLTMYTHQLDLEDCCGSATDSSFVIARSAATKQSSFTCRLDCFAALAMTDLVPCGDT